MPSQPYVIIPAAGSDAVDEWVRLGVEAQFAGKLPEAEKYYRQALRVAPNHAQATNNLAVAFAQQGNVNEALLTAERACLFDDALAVAHVNRAYMNLEADRIDEALDAARRAVRAAPTPAPDQSSYVNARLALAMVAATAGLADQALAAYRNILEVEPKHPVASVNCCFVQSLADLTPADLVAQRKQWYEQNKFTGPRKPHANDRSPDRPLRVGYVGGDFKRHSAAMIFGAVVLNHDPAQVESYLYSSLPVDPIQDDITRRFIESCGNYTLEPTGKTTTAANGAQVPVVTPKADRWRDISAMTDEEADALVRRDQIDILVDLAGHTNGGRLGLFCRKPAPVQLTGWGFAHGTGAPEIDYFLADPVAVPEAERGDFAERIIDLPCVVTYMPPTEYNLRGTSQLPFYKNDFITFGCYTRFEKISDACLGTFAEILRRVPDSRLEMKDHALRRPYSIRRVRQAMPDIDPKRLLFSISTSHPEHMLAHQQCDIALDPFPHGGGVVALEQLYMSVPLITLWGRQPSGRTATSVLANMGRTDWIARTPAEYVEKAVEWAGRPQDLAKARKTLRDELLTSPAVKGYREATEAAYRAAWREWCGK